MQPLEVNRIDKLTLLLRNFDATEGMRKSYRGTSPAGAVRMPFLVRASGLERGFGGDVCPASESGRRDRPKQKKMQPSARTPSGQAVLNSPHGASIAASAL
jgi:hypothetical protein